MKHLIRSLLALAGVLIALAAVPAFGQTPSPAASSAPGNLPAVPNSERADAGGLTPGHPSLPGPGGSSPLEPYLVTWLLPGSGIFAALVVVSVDRAMRNRRLR